MSLIPGSSRRLLSVLALAALVAGCSTGPKSPTLFTVGSRTFTVDDFKAYATAPGVLDRYAALPESAQKKALLDDLLDSETLAAAAERDGLDKDSAFVKLERDLPKKILPDALYDAKVGSQATASDEEAKLYYEAQDTEYSLAAIMANDSTVLQALEMRLNRGEPFEDVARTGSQDPTSSANGGHLGGWYTLGQFSPDIEASLRKLKVGERTGVVHQGQGYFIFKVLDTRPVKDKPAYEAQKTAVKEQLVQRKRAALAEKYLAGLRRGYDLKIAGPGWQVVNGVMTSLPDTLSRYLGTDPKRAGLTDADLASTLATWKGRTYTVKDLLQDLRDSDLRERPPTNRTDLFKTYVEGKAMVDILVAEAKKEGIDHTPKVERAIKHERTSLLVNLFLTKMPPPPAPTLAELDSTTSALVAAQGGPAASIHYANLPPQIQKQIEDELQKSKQRTLAQATLKREKEKLQPKVNDKVFDAIAWPVEPEAQEKA
jgi:parvulin-like peptidyl-prolyl isomerase